MPQTPASIAALLRTAAETGEVAPLRAVTSARITWFGAGGEIAARDRAEVLTRCAALGSGRPGPVVEEMFTFPTAVVLGLRGVHRLGRGRGGTAYYLFEVCRGEITAIRVFGDRLTALAGAEPYATALPRPLAP